MYTTSDGWQMESAAPLPGQENTIRAGNWQPSIQLPQPTLTDTKRYIITQVRRRARLSPYEQQRLVQAILHLRDQRRVATILLSDTRVAFQRLTEEEGNP